MTASRLVPLFGARAKALYVLGVAAWGASIAYFWSWWLNPAHVAWWAGFVGASLVFAWMMLVPFYFMSIFFGARRTRGELALPADSRVAIIVTKAPSEPPDVLKKTLTAMLAQDVPHDTWIADEDPGPEMVAWCREHGVRISTRKGVAAYHQQTWPRRTRCKEGNLAYFYDHYGYENYDFVAQLDADHVPAPTYLREMLKPFSDPEVGYVSAPSICSANASGSWAARSRLYHEAPWHGAQQIGYNDGWAPICIGSHYAVRTAALKAIGGLGPELAEDHSTTLLFNAGGWRGVHAVDAIAIGDGPQTFADLATQEFQWARSLVTILLQYTPDYIGSLSPRLKFQFLFCQFWYVFSSLAMLSLFLLPIAALAAGRNFADVTFVDFLLHYAPAGIVLTVMLYFWRRTGVFRPADAPILSWEGPVYLLVKWPWALAGCLAAVRDRLTGTFVDFRVTPKGTGPSAHLPRRVLMPYAILSVVAALPVFLVRDAGVAEGFYVFSIVNSVAYGGILLLIIAKHAQENGIAIGVSGSQLAYAAQLSAVVAILSLPGAAASLRGEQGVAALADGLWFVETEVVIAPPPARPLVRSEQPQISEIGPMPVPAIEAVGHPA